MQQAVTRMSQPMSVLTSQKTTNWFTPRLYIDMAREVLGEIDLDPASHPVPQEWIQARVYYTLDLQGFHADPAWTDSQYKLKLKQYSLWHLNAQPTWKGRVFLNPPFDATPVWVKRLTHDYNAGRESTSAIALVNSNHGYRWYEQFTRAFPICLATERIRFIKEDGTPGGQAKRGQTFVYLGNEFEKFADVFARIGRIIPVERRA